MSLTRSGRTTCALPTPRWPTAGDTAGNQRPAVTIRSLGYSDLPQVIAIERRAFPTPWSLAMFVLELSKPSGICLAAIEERRIVGYLICSRYADVWHLMNIAVDPPVRRRGIATALLEEMIARAGAATRRTRSRCARRTPARSRCTSVSASGRPARAGATTRTPERTP